MTNAEIADYLEYVNKWRRGHTEITEPMPDPYEIGEVIDLAIERLRIASSD